MASKHEDYFWGVHQQQNKVKTDIQMCPVQIRKCHLKSWVLFLIT